jgi:hypothetical protein
MSIPSDWKRSAAEFALNILGIIAGCSFLAGTFYALHLGADLKSPRVIDGLVSNHAQISVSVACRVVLGVALSVLGGFACALISKGWEYWLGIIVSAASVFTASQSEQVDLISPQVIVSTLLTFGSVLIGSRLGIMRNRRALK